MAPAAGGSQFTIALTQVPQDACVSMLSTATSYGSGLVSVAAGSVVIPAGASATPAAAASGCTEEQNNTVSYTVR